ncbi:MAG: hypothetical protein RLZZ592_273 [Pseudomonadota bacterium]|jgi:hypothetical protein
MKKDPVMPCRPIRHIAARLMLLLAPAVLAGCGVAMVAGSVAGAAISVGSAAVSVGATVVTTGVQVTGKAVGKAFDAIGGEPAVAPAEGGIVVAPLPGEPGASAPAPR